MLPIIVFIIFIFNLTIYIIQFFINKKVFFINKLLNISIFLLLLLELIIRSILIRFIALTNLYECLLFFSAIICLIIFIYELKKEYLLQLSFSGIFIGFIFFTIAFSPIIPKDIKEPIPALQSFWLIIHVGLSFIGESFFAISFIASVIYLINKDNQKKEIIENIIYKSIAIGYPIFTAGALIFGSIWAKYAWGRFWGWDPKETFALITFLIYTLYLHLRIVVKSNKKILVYISISGFLLTMFTLFGVNFLMTGLHSYR